MNNPRRIGPTGYFSSCGFWNRWEELHLNVTVKVKFKFHVSNEFHLSWRTGPLREFEILLTSDLGTFPLVVTFWLCFSLATRIRCLAGIFGRLLDRYKTASRSGTTEPQQSQIVEEDDANLTACDVRLFHHAVWLVLIDHVIRQMNKYTFRFQHRRSDFFQIVFSLTPFGHKNCLIKLLEGWRGIIS